MSNGISLSGSGPWILYVKAENPRAEYFLAKRLAELLPETDVSSALHSLREREEVPVLRVETEQEATELEQKLGIDGTKAWTVHQRKISGFDVY